MARTSPNLNVPLLFPEMAQDAVAKSPTSAEEDRLEKINRELSEAAKDGQKSQLSRANLPARIESLNTRNSVSIEALAFAEQALLPSYGNDHRVLDKQASAIAGPTKEIAMLDAFSTDLAYQPYQTLLKLAANDLFFRTGGLIGALILYTAQNNTDCILNIKSIRSAFDNFISAYSENSRKFIVHNQLNWNSAKELVEYFRTNPI